ncbi:hypothetical protein BVG19_g1754 [[Candida] boidinii]|nr:hypothetical protein BVG19_g1754 [[Candida] boidinii]OWB48769.1 hypothetical protein B5S27_g304 [[Candida] boidinii]GMF57237.1 unnamed protein product [[Candida] boidinii]
MTEWKTLEKKPKVLYFPWTLSVHHDESWKTLNEKFELVNYDCSSVDEFIEEARKPNGKYSGLDAICRSTRLNGMPFAAQHIFHGEAAKVIPDTVKLIVSSGHGYNKTDLELLAERGILFCNSPNTASQSTADVGVFLIIQSFRYLTYAEHYVRTNSKDDITNLTVNAENPRDKTLGIIGLGDIGVLVARTCKAMGMNIVYHNRNPKPQYESEIEGLKFLPNIDDLYAVSDCILLLCPYTPATRHLINFNTFKKMKDRVRLVNIARGAIVEEAAVIDALERGQLVGAGFDVTEFEPKFDDRILNNYKVTVLPHVGATARETFELAEKKCVENLMQFFYGDGKIDAVNKDLITKTS